MALSRKDKSLLVLHIIPDHHYQQQHHHHHRHHHYHHDHYYRRRSRRHYPHIYVYLIISLPPPSTSRRSDTHACILRSRKLFLVVTWANHCAQWVLDGQMLNDQLPLANAKVHLRESRLYSSHISGGSRSYRHQRNRHAANQLATK